MPHTEEREFTFRITLRANFAEDYDGDDGGYEWAKDLPTLQRVLLTQLADAAARDKRWSLRFGNRGRATEDEVVLVLERNFPDEAATRDS